MRQASRCCQDFLHNLQHKLDEFMGRRGVNDHMLALGKEAALALNWRKLVHRPPTREEYFAFFRLAALLRSVLQNTLWPHAMAFPYVQHSWPRDRGPNGWFQQFKLLVARVAEARSPGSQHKWTRTKLWVVHGVFRTCVDASLGQLPLWKGAMPAVARSHVCGLIGAWAALQGVSACNRPAFRVSPSALASVGNGRRLLGARGKKGEYTFQGGVGSLASAAAPQCLLGQVVRVVDAEVIFYDDALEASLSSCTKFTAANADGSHCYHAVRLVHRVRLLRAVESCCERWGSIIHQLWDGNVVWHPSRIAGRLLMREAGLAKSSPTTEAVVSEVARFLAERRGKNPFVQRESTRNKSAEVALSKEVQLEMRRALRESTYTSHDAKSIAQPTTLESKPAAQEALQRAVRLGHGGALAPLPVFFQDKRLALSDRATSTRREDLLKWLESTEAEAWHARRASLFGCNVNRPMLLALEEVVAPSTPTLS